MKYQQLKKKLFADNQKNTLLFRIIIVNKFHMKCDALIEKVFKYSKRDSNARERTFVGARLFALRFDVSINIVTTNVLEVEN